MVVDDELDDFGRRCFYPLRPCGFLYATFILLLCGGMAYMAVSPNQKLQLVSQNVVKPDTNTIDAEEGKVSYLSKDLERAIWNTFIIAKYDNLTRSNQIHTEMPVEEVTITREPNPPAEKVMICYYNTPQYSSTGQLLPTDINPHLCTHINIAFASIVNKEIFLDADQKRAVQDVSKLKVVNPKLKILLSIGGAQMAGEPNGFSEMVVDHASRKTFIKSIKSVLRNYSLDGIDLDWEFPATSSGVHRERQHFSQLLREIRAEYIREKQHYLLTIAVAAIEVVVEYSYDVDQINLYTDFVNIMTYDYHSYSEYTPFTGLNSPLYARSDERLYLSSLNINYTCSMFMRKGLDRNKIVVGIPTYGHTFYLVNPENANISSPTSGFGTLGTSGFVDYPNICKYMMKYHNSIHYEKDTEALVPYLHRSHNWVSYDDPESVNKKAQFIKDNHFRGAMIYSLNADDHTGACKLSRGSTKFPISQSVRQTLFD